MSKSTETLTSQLLQHFGDKVRVLTEFDEVTVEILDRNELLSVCETLRDNEAFAFEELIDICGVDYLSFGEAEWDTTMATGSGFSRGVNRSNSPSATQNKDKRFAAVYHLLSMAHNCRLRLKVFVHEDNLIVDSAVDVWASANWFEREAFDLYGIMFRGHPDLRRLLTDYGFIGHPFRKDFPLIGNVEMRYDAEKRRVIYQPVSIEPRTLVPKVIRDDKLDALANQGGK